MKRENIFISENRTAKRVVATKFIAPGDVPAFDCLIRFGKEENDVTMQNCNIKDSAIVKCSPDDTYDFEVGALIALMRMCGVEKVKKAAKETFFDVAENSVNEYEEKIHALEEEIKCLKEKNAELLGEKSHLKYIKSCNESTIESLESTRGLLINKNNELIEENRAFTRKCVDEWLYKIPTKRNEMWEKILGVTKCSSVEIKVVKQDITTFLRELQDKMSEVRWNGSDCLPVDLSVPDWFKHDYIYFFLFRNYDKGNLHLCYGVKPHSCPSWVRIKVDYLPPMRWDLFKKGRLAVKVTYENYKEFYEACEKELGKKPASMYCGDFVCSFEFETFTIEHQKKTGRKIVNWEDVR